MAGWPARWSQPLLVLGLACLAATCLLLLGLTGDDRQSTNLAILIFVLGCFVLSRGWLVAALSVMIAAWGLVVWCTVSEPDWVHYGLLMAESTFFAVVINVARVSTIVRSQWLRHQERRRFERTQQLESTVLRLSKDLAAAGGDFDSAIRQITEAGAFALPAERASVWMLSEDGTGATCVDRFAPAPSRHEAGMTVVFAERPSYPETLREERVLAIDDVRTDDRTSPHADRVYTPSGITAILDAPVRHWGQVAGFVSIERGGDPRPWTAEEAVFGVELAGLVAQALLNRGHQSDQERLRTSEELYRRTMDSIGDAIHVMDREFRLVLSNSRFKAWCAELGIAPLAPGQHVFEALAFLPERVRREYEEVVETGKTFDSEDVMEVAGRRFVTETRKVPVFTNGRVEQVVTLIRDLTERRRIEEEKSDLEALMQQTQRLDSLGALAGGIAHDFNNLLAVVLGHASLLERAAADEDAVKQEAHMIAQAAERGARLTKQLLGFARRGKYRNTAVDVHEVIIGLDLLLSHTLDKRIGRRLLLDAKAHTVMGDPSQLEQVFLNLAINAADAMHGGGRLRIRTAERELRPDEWRQEAELKPGQYLLVEVTDTGSGISEELKERIFEPFFTTKEVGKGTGLGLATVYGVVASHHGTIWVDSRPGRGSTFSLLLPLTEARASHSPGAPEEESILQGTGNVLVVDDEEPLRRLLGKMLGHLGYEHVAVPDGPTAIAHYREHPDEFDLVIIDMMMPGLTGAECFRELKRINPDLRALLATGYDRGQGVEQLLAEGLRGFIQKPFSFQNLARAVDDALGWPA